MNVIEVFQNKVKSMFAEEAQSLNEVLIELATFFYKVDMRISLEEQKYMEDLMSSLEWTSTINVEAFQQDCIARVNEILSGTEDEITRYLSGLMDALEKVDGVEKAKKIAQELSDADGEIADDEVKYLEIVTAY